MDLRFRLALGSLVEQSPPQELPSWCGIKRLGPFWREGLTSQHSSVEGTNAMQVQLRPTRESRHAATNFFCWTLHPEAQRPQLPLVAIGKSGSSQTEGPLHPC